MADIEYEDEEEERNSGAAAGAYSGYSGDEEEEEEEVGSSLATSELVSNLDIIQFFHPVFLSTLVVLFCFV